MARTLLTAVSAPGYVTTAGVLLNFVAVDVANGNAYKCTGREVLYVRNADAVNPHTLTVVSVPDSRGRTGDCVTQVPLSGYGIAGPFPLVGWIQSDGMVYLNGDNVNLQVAVITLPGN